MRRRVLKVLMLLLLGAIVNVAVAWGCVRWSSVRCDRVAIRARWGHDSTWIGIERSLGVGLEQHELMHTLGRRLQPDADSIITVPVPYLHAKEPSRILAVDTPHWSRLGIDPGNPDRVIELEQASGWPMRSMHCNILESHQDGTWVENPAYAIVADRRDWPVSRVYPMGIIWPGFAINTIFYAAVLWGGWALFAAPFALRRRRRLKRGLCPACAYPIGTSNVCTECGAQLRCAAPVISGD